MRVPLKIDISFAEFYLKGTQNNEASICDVLFILIYFLSKRIRIIAENIDIH